MLVARRPEGRGLLTIQRSCHDKAAGAEQRTVRMLWTSEERSMCCATDTSDQGLNNGGRLKHRDIYTVLLVQCVTKQ